MPKYRTILLPWIHTRRFRTNVGQINRTRRTAYVKRVFLSFEWTCGTQKLPIAVICQAEVFPHLRKSFMKSDINDYPDNFSSD